MARAKKNSKIPTVEELIEDLTAKGGYHVPWYDVKGATYGPTRNEALRSGQVEITLDGGLALAKKKASEEG